MQVSVEATSGLERRLIVGVPSADIDKEVTKRLQQAAKTVRINGFRKGKVPFKVVRQRFGAGVQQEVLGDAINRTFQEALREKSLRPAGQPRIETRNFDEGGTFEYVATFEVYPEFSLNDIEGAEIKQYQSEITETDIDEMIETLRKNQSSWVEVEREAREGDTVLIDFVGKKDGETFDGGSAEGYRLILGSKSMIPGFEDGVAGMKAGEEKTLTLTFPDDYQVEELRGAEAEFHVTVSAVSEKQLPELDDGFFAGFGVTEGGIDAFRADVRVNMEREKENLIRARTKNQVMDELLKRNPIDTPQALVQSEIQVLREQTLQQYGQLNTKFDMKALLPDHLFEARARKRTALGLLIADIVSKNEIKIDRDRLKTLVEGIASTYEDPESVVSYYYNNRELLGSAEAAVLEDQVVDLLLEKAIVKQSSVSYSELVKAEEASEAAEAGTESPEVLQDQETQND